MNSYMLYIQDDRYRTTTLEVVLADEDPAAAELARLCLASSDHYLSIEVWDDDRLVERLEKGENLAPIPVPHRDTPPNGRQEGG